MSSNWRQIWLIQIDARVTNQNTQFNPFCHSQWSVSHKHTHKSALNCAQCTRRCWDFINEITKQRRWPFKPQFTHVGLTDVTVRVGMFRPERSRLWDGTTLLGNSRSLSLSKHYNRQRWKKWILLLKVTLYKKCFITSKNTEILRAKCSLLELKNARSHILFHY